MIYNFIFYNLINVIIYYFITLCTVYCIAIYIIVYNIIYDVIYHSVSPMKWGDLLFLALLSVGPSVGVSICPSVWWFTLSCTIFICWTPGGIYIFSARMLVWLVDVQCVCLTKVGSRSRSKFKVKHCMTVLLVGSTPFKPMVRLTNNSAQKSSMMSQCAVHMFDQG